MEKIMKLNFRLSVVAAALIVVGGACSSSSSITGSGGADAKGGSSASGGAVGSGGTTAAGSGGSSANGGISGSGGQPPNCTNGSTCGGALVGTWKVTSSCLTLSGDMDVRLASLGCPTVPVTGSLQVTGTWTANADGSYTDETTTTGSITFPAAASCLSVSSVPVDCSKISGTITALGWKTANCSTDASGQCNCSATADQSGGIGVVNPWAASSGTYTTSGSGLNTDTYVDYSYCVSGNTLTLTPKPTILPVTGTVVLQKSGTSPGTGGAGGAGGATTGAGGTTTGSGGRTGSGGATTGSGGATTGSGGRTGAGGAATGGTTSAGGGTGTGPCDIYTAAGNTCVAAHSTVRALLGSYSGALYQVKRASDKTTKDIGLLSPGGIAQSSTQDDFCTGTTCTITKVYDQSGHGNFLSAETPDAEDPSVRPQSATSTETAASATAESLNVSGHKVYSLKMQTSQAYWRDGSKSGMPTGSQSMGVYMVTSGKFYNSGCCFDSGNGETSRTYVAGRTMNAVYFGNSTQWGSGAGSGPWVMADLEGGIFSGATTGNNPNSPTQTATYVTAYEKNNGTSEFQIKGADATNGTLGTYYKGSIPGAPMAMQGSIVLGSGGDCCYSNNNASRGTFYEGVIVTGYPSDATDNAVQANIVSAGYGK
jgi:hypothetical protein